MQVTTNTETIRQARRDAELSTWGLVPTMGYLHEGHLSLVRKAKAECEKVAVTIFVNPIQFNNPADLAAYPVDLDRDLAQLEKEGVDLVWAPEERDVYPENFQTYVEVTELSQPLEGAHRPGHFRGVTTVVAKLLNLFRPNRAYFGEKDRQQLLIIQRMVADLNMETEIVPCPIVRESSGLAMSSRNKRLSRAGRETAACLYQTLVAARQAVISGETDCTQIKRNMMKILRQHPGVREDYVSVASPETLQELEVVTGKAIISLAAEVDGVRLIDNIAVDVTTGRC